MRDRMGPKPHCALKVSAWIVKYFLVPCVTLYCTVSVSHRREVQREKKDEKKESFTVKLLPKLPECRARVRAGSCDLPAANDARKTLSVSPSPRPRNATRVLCGIYIISYFNYESIDSTANRQSSGTSRGIGQRVAVLMMLPGPRVMEVP